MEQTKCGIYCLYWHNTKHFYIGKSSDIDARYKSHLQALRTNTHSSKKLIKIYNEFGDPSIKVLEYCDYDNLHPIELTYLKPLDGNEFSCNCHTGKTPKRKQPMRSVNISMPKNNFKTIRIKYGTIQNFIDAYIKAGLPDF